MSYSLCGYPEVIQVLICTYLMPEENARIAYVTGIPELGLVNNSLVHLNLEAKTKMTGYLGIMAHPMDIGMITIEAGDRVGLVTDEDKSEQFDIIIRDYIKKYSIIRPEHVSSNYIGDAFDGKFKHWIQPVFLDSRKIKAIKSRLEKLQQIEIKSGSKSESKSKSKNHTESVSGPDLEKIRNEIIELETKISIASDADPEKIKRISFADYPISTEQLNFVKTELRNVRAKKLGFTHTETYLTIMKEIPGLFIELEELALPDMEIDHKQIKIPGSVRKLTLTRPSPNALKKYKCLKPVFEKTPKLEELTLVEPEYRKIRQLLSDIPAKNTKILMGGGKFKNNIINFRDFIPEGTECFSFRVNFNYDRDFDYNEWYSLDLGKVPDSLETLAILGNISVISIQPNNIRNLYVFPNSESDTYPDLRSFAKLESLHTSRTEIDVDVPEVKFYSSLFKITNKHEIVTSTGDFPYNEHGQENLAPIISTFNRYIYNGKPSDVPKRHFDYPEGVILEERRKKETPDSNSDSEHD